MAMGATVDCPLPFTVTEVGPGSWASSAALYRFVWAVRRQCLSESVLNAVPGRAALALWISGLDLPEFGGSGSCVASRDDERLLDWVVLSVRRGWTPKGVLTWIFSHFGGLLFDLALDAACSS